jgi:protoporphyrinogen oxidase
MSKKIAIVGGGLTGLTLAYYLSKKNDIYVFEKEKDLGGLTQSFCLPKWKWPLENHYHHIFSNDKEIINFAKKLGLKFQFTSPITSSLINNQIVKISGPIDLLKFPNLSIFNRIRMALILAYFKLTPFWHCFEKHTSKQWLIKFMGRENFRVLWMPLFDKKFHNLQNKISLTWFYARIKKRTTKLGYLEKGFSDFFLKISQKIKENNANIVNNTEIKNIKKLKNNKFEISYLQANQNKKITNFDKVIFTTSNEIILRIYKDFPKKYQKQMTRIDHFGALTMVLILKKPFLRNKTYWLNINDKEYPFLAIIEHTNFIKKKFYNNQHIIYISQYLPTSHKLMTLNKSEVLEKYLPYLKKINENIKENLIESKIFKSYCAQPIVTTNFSKKIIPFQTPEENLFVVNMSQIYPYDRGTNYAVNLAEKFIKFYAKIN